MTQQSIQSLNESIKPNMSRLLRKEIALDIFDDGSWLITISPQKIRIAGTNWKTLAEVTKQLKS